MSTFLLQLFKICEDRQVHTTIRWSLDGLSFEVLNKQHFEKAILPVFFRHSNMNSFVRQLNMYDFHKRRRSLHDIIFYHPFFVKDRPDLLCQIKRKTNSQYSDVRKQEEFFKNTRREIKGD